MAAGRGRTFLVGSLLAMIVMLGFAIATGITSYRSQSHSTTHEGNSIEDSNLENFPFGDCQSEPSCETKLPELKLSKGGSSDSCSDTFLRNPELAVVASPAAIVQYPEANDIFTEEAIFEFKAVPEPNRLNASCRRSAFRKRFKKKGKRMNARKKRRPKEPCQYGSKKDCKDVIPVQNKDWLMPITNDGAIFKTTIEPELPSGSHEHVTIQSPSMNPSSLSRHKISPRCHIHSVVQADGCRAVNT